MDYRTLHVFDFDGTLFRSPERPLWWGDRKWWTDPSSLNAPMVPEQPGSDWWNQDVVARAKRAYQGPDNLTFLLTGRLRSVFHNRVHTLLKQAQLKFHHIYLSDGTSTEVFKLGILRTTLDKYPTIRGVSIWEDRGEHLRQFHDAVEDMGRACLPHLVTTTPHDLGCTEEGWLMPQRMASAVAVADRYALMQEQS